MGRQADRQSGRQGRTAAPAARPPALRLGGDLVRDDHVTRVALRGAAAALQLPAQRDRLAGPTTSTCNGVSCNAAGRHVRLERSNRSCTRVTKVHVHYCRRLRAEPVRDVGMVATRDGICRPKLCNVLRRCAPTPAARGRKGPGTLRSRSRTHVAAKGPRSRTYTVLRGVPSSAPASSLNACRNVLCSAPPPCHCSHV